MSSPHAFSNALTLYEVPDGMYPLFDAAKDKLVEKALNGEEVYVYHPVGNELRWNLWINEMRFDLRDWQGEGLASHA